MDLKNPAGVGDTLYYAHVDSLWKGDRLHSAEVVVDAHTVIEKRKNYYVLNRPSSMTGGSTQVDVGSKQDLNFRSSRSSAILHLYQKMIRRIALVNGHPDVLSGKVSEAAAIVEGLS